VLGLATSWPARRITHAPRLSAANDRKVPDPVDLQTLRESLNSENPAAAALSALLAFHGVRAMLFTDVHDGRLHIGDQVIVSRRMCGATSLPGVPGHPKWQPRVGQLGDRTAMLDPSHLSVPSAFVANSLEL
jgi:hypothetical protein